MSEIKQKDVIKKIVENRGNVGQAMKESGYSDAYSRNPHQLMATKSFQELLEKDLPDELLTSKHKDLLESKKVISANVFPDGKDGKPVNDFIEVPDNQTQAKMVELGYKVKNKLIDRSEVDLHANVLNLNDKQSEQLLRARANRRNTQRTSK